MKIKRRIASWLIACAIFGALTAVASASKRDQAKAATLDPAVYEILTVADVVSQYKDDPKEAGKHFNRYNIALVGKVTSISEKHESIQLENIENIPTFSCKVSDKSLQGEASKLEKNSYVLITGTVKSATQKAFSVEATQILPVDEKWAEKPAGKVDAAGTIYDKDTDLISESNIQGISFLYPSSWKSYEEQMMKVYRLGSRESVMQFDLGNREYVNIYSFEWEKLKNAMSGAEDPVVGIYVELKAVDRAETYITGQLAPGLRVTGDNMGSVTTESLKYDYRICTDRSGNICLEEFFTKIGDRLIAVVYYHDDGAKYAQQAAFFLGCIQPAEQ